MSKVVYSSLSKLFANSLTTTSLMQGNLFVYLKRHSVPGRINTKGAGREGGGGIGGWRKRRGMREGGGGVSKGDSYLILLIKSLYLEFAKITQNWC